MFKIQGFGATMAAFAAMVLVAVLVSIGIGSVCGCPPAPTTPGPDAEAGAPTSASCASACANLRAINCADGFSVDGGQSCESTCQHTLDGTYDMHLACLTSATSVASARACMSVTCP